MEYSKIIRQKCKIKITNTHKKTIHCTDEQYKKEETLRTVEMYTLTKVVAINHSGDDRIIYFIESNSNF